MHSKLFIYGCTNDREPFLWNSFLPRISLSPVLSLSRSREGTELNTLEKTLDIYRFASLAVLSEGCLKWPLTSFRCEQNFLCVYKRNDRLVWTHHLPQIYNFYLCFSLCLIYITLSCYFYLVAYKNEKRPSDP